jgi:hypothetical protein
VLISPVHAVLFRCAKGSNFPPHLHYGAGEYLMFSGVMDYRMGIAKARLFASPPERPPRSVSLPHLA